MITNAKTIQAGCNAGLTLVGQDKDGVPEWVGTELQWTRFDELLDRADRDGEAIELEINNLKENPHQYE